MPDHHLAADLPGDHQAHHTGGQDPVEQPGRQVPDPDDVQSIAQHRCVLKKKRDRIAHCGNDGIGSFPSSPSLDELSFDSPYLPLEYLPKNVPRKVSMKNTRAAILLTLACLLAVPALAQFRKPEDAVKYRQSVMYTMGTHL